MLGSVLLAKADLYQDRGVIGILPGIGVCPDIHLAAFIKPSISIIRPAGRCPEFHTLVVKQPANDALNEFSLQRDSDVRVRIVQLPNWLPKPLVVLVAEAV